MEAMPDQSLNRSGDSQALEYSIQLLSQSEHFLTQSSLYNHIETGACCLQTIRTSTYIRLLCVIHDGSSSKRGFVASLLCLIGLFLALLHGICLVHLRLCQMLPSSPWGNLLGQSLVCYFHFLHRFCLLHSRFLFLASFRFPQRACPIGYQQSQVSLVR